MNRYLELAENEQSENLKEIYKIIGSKDENPRGAAKGVKDSSYRPASFTYDEVTTIQRSLEEEVEARYVADGGFRTMEDFKKGMILDPEALAKKFVSREQGMAVDSFYNAVTGIGTGIDPGSYNTADTPISIGPQEATAYYSNGGIPATIIDKKFKGIFANGYRFTGLEEDEVDALKDHAESLNFVKAVEDWWRDGGIYGGALCIPALKGDNPISYQMTVDELVKSRKLKKDSIDYFWTVDRWNAVLIPNYDISAKDFITPSEFYVPLAGIAVNSNRMSVGRPKELPYWGTIRQMGWGISDFVSFMPSLLTYEVMMRSLPIIAQQLNLMYSHVPIDSMLAQSGLNAVKQLIKTNEEALREWNMLNPRGFSTFAEIKTIERHFTDFDKLVLLAQKDVGAKSGISHTILFNEQQASMNEKDDDTTLKQAEIVKKSANTASMQLQNVVTMLVASCFGPDSPQFKKAKQVRIVFDSPTIQTNEQKIAALTASATAFSTFVAGGIQVEDSLDIVRQFVPNLEISDEMRERIGAIDDREEELDEERADAEVKALGTERVDSDGDEGPAPVTNAATTGAPGKSKDSGFWKWLKRGRE